MVPLRGERIRSLFTPRDARRDFILDPLNQRFNGDFGDVKETNRKMRDLVFETQSCHGCLVLSFGRNVDVWEESKCIRPQVCQIVVEEIEKEGMRSEDLQNLHNDVRPCSIGYLCSQSSSNETTKSMFLKNIVAMTSNGRTMTLLVRQQIESRCEEEKKEDQEKRTCLQSYTFDLCGKRQGRLTQSSCGPPSTVVAACHDERSQSCWTLSLNGRVRQYAAVGMSPSAADASASTAAVDGAW